MFYSLLIIAAIVVAIYWLKRWQNLPEKERAKAGKQYVLWGLAAVMLGMVLAGRAHWLMGVLAGLMAVAGRVAQVAQYVPLFKKIYDDVNAGQGQNQSGSQGHNAARSAMTRQEAADILGVHIDADADEVRLAHKKLMQKIHPDRGGSDALAKQINQAKDVLLG